jgi:uncharacterized membrane protein
MPKTTTTPEVAKITIYDLIDIIGAGLRDFTAAPKFGLAFGGLFAVGGWLLIAFLWYLKLTYLVYPTAMGFALIAPLAAVGFYAVSDQLDKGIAPTWSSVLGAVRHALTRSDLRWMTPVTGFAFFLWVDIAAILFLSLIGMNAFDGNFLTTLFTTPNGLLFLVLGNLSGALIALAIFSVAAVSIPMLFDRNVDFVTAMLTSVRLVVSNPVTMGLWCAIIAVSVGLSIASAFVGLFVVMPVIGHASWHLYRRAVSREEPMEKAATA